MLGPKAIGTLRALRWAGARLLAVAVVVSVLVGLFLWAPVPGTTATDAPDVAADTNPEPVVPPEEMNRSAVQREFLELLNDERRDQDLGALESRDQLHRMGRAHAENMAANDYIGHDEPGPGGTIEDRYRERGLLPECRLPIDDRRYYPGAENAAGGGLGDVDVAGQTIEVDDPESVAKWLYLLWMHSPEHRRAMLVESADEAGLGVVITDDRRVYASLELC